MADKSDWQRRAELIVASEFMSARVAIFIVGRRDRSHFDARHVARLGGDGQVRWREQRRGRRRTAACEVSWLEHPLQRKWHDGLTLWRKVFSKCARLLAERRCVVKIAASTALKGGTST